MKNRSGLQSGLQNGGVESTLVRLLSVPPVCLQGKLPPPEVPVWQFSSCRLVALCLAGGQAHHKQKPRTVCIRKRCGVAHGTVSAYELVAPIELPTDVKVALAFVPSAVIAAMHTTMISASMTAYS